MLIIDSDQTKNRSLIDQTFANGYYVAVGERMGAALVIVVKAANANNPSKWKEIRTYDAMLAG